MHHRASKQSIFYGVYDSAWYDSLIDDRVISGTKGSCVFTADNVKVKSWQNIILSDDTGEEREKQS